VGFRVEGGGHRRLGNDDPERAGIRLLPVDGGGRRDWLVENLRPTLDAAGFQEMKVMIWDHDRDHLKLRADGTFAVAGAGAAA
jgi:hypothetical protein